jgi:hypothetical protein
MQRGRDISAQIVLDTSVQMSPYDSITGRVSGDRLMIVSCFASRKSPQPAIEKMITLKSTQALFAVAAKLISSWVVNQAAEKTLVIAYTSASAEFPWLALAAKAATEEAKKLNVDSDWRCQQGARSNKRD